MVRPYLKKKYTNIKTHIIERKRKRELFIVIFPPMYPCICGTIITKSLPRWKLF